VFGRRARGERLTRGLIHDAWEIRRNGRLVWCDAFRLHGNIDRALASAACLAQAAAVATIIYVADAVGPALTLARQLADMITVEGVLVGVTAVGGVLIARWLGYDARLLRLAFGAFWAAFRHHMAGFQEVLPRLWSV
jgi:urease accessory protein